MTEIQWCVYIRHSVANTHAVPLHDRGEHLPISNGPGHIFHDWLLLLSLGITRHLWVKIVQSLSIYFAAGWKQWERIKRTERARGIARTVDSIVIVRPSNVCVSHTIFFLRSTTTKSNDENDVVKSDSEKLWIIVIDTTVAANVMQYTINKTNCV